MPKNYSPDFHSQIEREIHHVLKRTWFRALFQKHPKQPRIITNETRSEQYSKGALKPIPEKTP